MRIPREGEAVDQVVDRLEELLGSAPDEIRRDQAAADLIVDAGDLRLVVEYKSSGATAPIASALRQLRRYRSDSGRHVVPVVAAPFMGATGRQLCEEASVSWLDLSGNARIFAPGLRILVEGQPNRFKGRGRPSSAFAPKSARIARWLLMHPDRPMTQREIARATEMDEGFTSRIVAKLEEDELVVRDPDGAIRPRDPDLLLDAWGEDYEFFKHRLRRGHVAARSGAILLERVAAELDASGAQGAFTGLAAAWQMTKFATFRIVTVYLPEFPDPTLLDRLGFREESSGANLWLVTPNDEGVFQGAAPRDGIPCVHPVQAYLDTRAHPERGQEAAERLRDERLKWTGDD